MIEVTKEAFFKVMGPLNVNPHSERDVTLWKLADSRRIIGRSEPGYIDAMRQKRWWLIEELVPR